MIAEFFLFLGNFLFYFPCLYLESRMQQKEKKIWSHTADILTKYMGTILNFFYTNDSGEGEIKPGILSAEIDVFNYLSYKFLVLFLRF